MAIFKCKMCGGTLEIQENATVAVCEYCGTQQTLPKLSDERRTNLYDRANHFRRNNEFDKAMGIYEQILNEDKTDAEAYWSLVLTRYGIEYVEDPASHKRVPTINRAQFTSIFDDDNYKSALQYADGSQRSIYEAEAKAINEIQKGILAISQKEEPFDVFICYKETDNNGRRTPDSVLANDLYHQLTLEGFKVFFARITLEDKLGIAYEPYIFAALNSAKVMVVLGTKPEYFNAVWVKNEWSRYLALIKTGAKKLLIPAYKDMDPYDLPDEFSHLQAQDMSKLGFMQDLIRGIKKIIATDEQKPATVKETVVVQQGGGANVAALLERGNMALEDGEWVKADGFFEEVLNNDAKNAQAYLGKALAQERCRTIAAFVQKRKDASQDVRGNETRHLEKNDKHVAAMVAKYAIPNYVEKKEIYKLYDFNLSYCTTVAERKQQYQNEETYWANHKLLSRAEQFADGILAESLQAEKKVLFDVLSDRIKQAEEAEASAKENLQSRYDTHLKYADETAKGIYEDGWQRREAHYQSMLQTANSSSVITELIDTAGKFELLGDYQDSRNLAEYCHKRADEEQIKLDEEAERQRIIREKQEIAQRAKNKKLGIIAAVATVVVIAFLTVLTCVIIPNSKYDKALALMDAEKYEEAIPVFRGLKDHKDSADKALECQYSLALALIDSGKYEEAIPVIEELDDYKDSVDKVLECKYNIALALKDADKTVEAAIAYGVLGDYKDARESSFALWEEIAVRESIYAGWDHTVGLKADGTVIATGANQDGECDVSDWTNVVTIAGTDSRTVGLKANGTVVATGENFYGECDVSDWTDIVAIAAGLEHTVGLKTNGTVVATGKNSAGRCDVSDWTDIIAIAAGWEHIVGLKTNGTVVATGSNGDGQCNVSGWTDIVAITTYNSCTLGLRSDGTVVATGYNSYGQCDVSDWTDIVAITGNDSYTVGLRSDGTVVATGSNSWGQCDVSDWTDIVAIIAEYPCTFGIKSDGTVVATGSNSCGQCDVSDWTDIVVIAAGAFHTVGLKSDGTVVATGETAEGQCNVSGWTNIKLPHG